MISITNNCIVEPYNINTRITYYKDIFTKLHTNTITTILLIQLTKMFSISDSPAIPRTEDKCFVPYKDTYYNVEYIDTYESPDDNRVFIRIRDESGQLVKEFPLSLRFIIRYVRIVSDMIVIYVGDNSLQITKCFTYNVKACELNEIMFNSTLISCVSDELFCRLCYGGYEIRIEKIGDGGSKVKYDFPKIILDPIINRGGRSYIKENTSFKFIDGEFKICFWYIREGKRVPVIYDLDGKLSEINLPVIRYNMKMYAGNERWGEHHHFCSDGSYYFVNTDGIVSMCLGYDDTPVPLEIQEHEDIDNPKNILAIESVYKDSNSTHIWLRIFSGETKKSSFVLLSNTGRRVKSGYK